MEGRLPTKSSPAPGGGPRVQKYILGRPAARFHHLGIAAPPRIASTRLPGGDRVHTAEVDVALGPLVDGPPSAESLDRRRWKPRLDLDLGSVPVRIVNLCGSEPRPRDLPAFLTRSRSDLVRNAG